MEMEEVAKQPLMAGKEKCIFWDLFLLIIFNFCDFLMESDLNPSLGSAASVRDLLPNRDLPLPLFFGSTMALDVGETRREANCPYIHSTLSPICRRLRH